MKHLVLTVFLVFFVAACNSPVAIGSVSTLAKDGTLVSAKKATVRNKRFSEAAAIKTLKEAMAKECGGSSYKIISLETDYTTYAKAMKSGDQAGWGGEIKFTCS